MTDDAKKFIECLEQAGQLLKDYPIQDLRQDDPDLSYTPPDKFNLALFEKWTELIEPEFRQVPPVRIMHHLSCTGGSLLCKCVAGLPNVALLSEVNPLSQLHVDSDLRFAPSDLTYLAILGKIPMIDELSEQIFRADIDVITKHTRQLGKHLVIREHSHSDFLVGETPVGFSTVKKLLQDRYTVLAVLTVRHPLDSYLSLLNNGWIHYTPNTFDEYCRRYLLFIEHNEAVPVYKYEDFVNQPVKEMKLICEALDLPFSEDFQDVFDLNRMSGDSGRTSSVIEKRDRLALNDGLIEELGGSESYPLLCTKLGYDLVTG